MCERCKDYIGKCQYCGTVLPTIEELDLLKWLGTEEYSQYGECHGKTLDSLIGKGLAQLHNGREQQSGFIARGDSQMYQAVSLTSAGRTALASLSE